MVELNEVSLTHFLVQPYILQSDGGFDKQRIWEPISYLKCHLVPPRFIKAHKTLIA